jgi:hypothetical protein
MNTFEPWLTEQILKLSVDTLKNEAVTCTACAETQGEYITSSIRVSNFAILLIARMLF